MRQVYTSGYTFKPAQRQVDVTQFGGFDLGRLTAIVNKASNTQLYLAGDPTLGGSIASGIITLTVNTVGMSANDPLALFYEGDLFTQTAPAYVSVGTSALPVGAATAAAQTAVQSSPGSVAATALTVQGSPAGVALPVSLASVPSHPVTQGGSWSVSVSGTASVSAAQSGTWTVGLASGTSVSVSNLPATQAVSAASLPLPVGAATDAKVEAVRALLAAPLTVQGAVTVSDGAGPLTVDGSVAITNLPVTQAVSGTFWQPTQPVSAASLPLPTGAASDATLSSGLGTDGASPPAIAGTGVRGWLRAILETLKSTLTVQGTVGLGAGSAVIGKVGLQVAGVDAGPANPLTVAGASAVGSAPTNPPVSVAGVDTGGLKRHVLTDTLGRLSVVSAGSLGAPIDASGSQPTPGALLGTIPADSTRKGSWFAQNQSAVDLLLVLDDGNGGAATMMPMNQADSVGRQGGAYTSANVGLHVGRIRVYGPAGSQFALRAQ